MSGLQYFMPKQPSTDDLLGAISGGSGLSLYGGASSQPSVDMNAAAASTPVKLMQRFVNNRGWGDVDVTGMRDWRGNTLSNQSMAGYNANANTNADADKWVALSILLNRMNGRNSLIYNRPNIGGGY